MISIITVAYNEAKTIEKTILSILKQDYRLFEFIVIDGFSTDCTFEIVKSYSSQFSNKGIKFQYISEKDDGIYDAMNKGVFLSSGEWLIFMNAADTFHSDKVLSSIFEATDYSNYEILYGDSIFIDNGNSYVKKSNQIDKIIKFFPFCHQSSFIRRELLIKNPYSLKYKIISDYNFFLAEYLNGKRFKKIQFLISNHDMSGISNSNTILGHEEKIIILKEFKIINSKKVEFIENVKFKLKYFTKKLIGLKLTAVIRKIKSYIKN
jgi:glycosyltransferase involved in cell wall biosynthesis